MKSQGLASITEGGVIITNGDKNSVELSKVRVEVWTNQGDPYVYGYSWNEFNEVFDCLKKENLDVEVESIEEIKIGPVITIPTGILVAGVAAVSSILIALLQYISQRNAGRIILKGSSGAMIEVPKDTPKEDIDIYIQKAKELDTKDIIVDVSDEN